MSHAAETIESGSGDDPVIARKVGRILDATGGALVAVAVAVTVLQAASVTATDQRSDSPARPLADWSAGTIAVPFVVLLFAMCALIPGEILRRGVIGPGDPGRPPTLLPKASFVAEFRPIGLRVHGVWAVCLVIVAMALTIALAASVAVGAWPATVGVRGDYSVLTSLGVWAVVLGAVAGATVGSFVKKSVYVSVVRRRGIIDRDARGRAFWTWFSMRWRLDLWLCAVAGVALTFAGIALIDDVSAAIVFATAGLVFLAAGLVAAANYWRAGVPLGIGESFA